MQAAMKSRGTLSIRRTRGVPSRALSFVEFLKFALPMPGLPREVNLWRLRNLPYLFSGLWPLRMLAARLLRIPHFYSQLALTVTRDGIRIPLGLASLRVITTAGVDEIATRFAGTSAANIANFKYHGFGTGTASESTSDTALGAELTTEYATDNTRPTGSQSSSSNTYITAATLSPDSGGTLAITEHGIFTQAANSGGTLLDRSKFAAINLVAGSDSLTATYILTLSAGG